MGRPGGRAPRYDRRAAGFPSSPSYPPAMTDDTPTGRRGGLAARLAAIALVGLVAGFVLGWFMRGDSGTATILPPADTPAATTPARTVTDTTPGTTTAPADLPPRGGIRLAVLNGTDVAGLAARTASRAQGLGYPSPATGNAPSGTGPTVVYFRQGARDAARRK